MLSKKIEPAPHFINRLFPVFFSIFALLFSPACEKEPPPLKIGFSGCITGQLADLGIAGRNAVTLAVEEINRAGGINGRKIELIVKDDANTPETAIRVDRELIAEGVVAIIGHVTSSMSIAALPVANKNKIIMLSPTSTTNELSGKDDYFFRVTSPDRIQSEIMAKHAFNKLNLRRVACLYDLSNRGFTQGWADNFRTLFEQLGGTVAVSVTFHAKEKFSYLEIAGQLMNFQPDSILIISGALHTAMFCQQIRKTTPDIPILSSGWAGTNELIHQGGSSVEGIIFPQVFNQNSRHLPYLTFRESYRERFMIEPNFASMCSYEAATFLFNILDGWDGKSDLKQILLDHSTHQGLQGEISLDKYGDASRSQFIVTVNDGSFAIVDTIMP
ncbi:Extracellular ligand-binding receptor [Desulfamplus magnetovallimortis]|uniref:Extracellular ligand-binding receptor n=1 Tax=Desulfamplus magnetovallimortis TaxID=1246637 RepID=A0A1W1H7U5_9BACT|nr:ABC transporter substrate-binding protein [Desulfamplus magnetovallimortis]SLM28547.1 Extracellular ligand-binding receptor [Desulfamplus magnetovallimortis]